MKFVAIPVLDSDNTDPPDLEIEVLPSGEVEFTLHSPARRFRLASHDWRCLSAATRTSGEGGT